MVGDAMNKLQKYYIIREHKAKVEIIGTNSGQAFVRAAADKHMERLLNRITGTFQIVEVHKLKDFI
jgi:hypothetical protein